ncbi:MAG: integrin alpha, partial [Myxococcota bacterium]
IVGAYGAEDRSTVGYPYDIGGVFWYRNAPNGFPSHPSGQRWGVVPDGAGGWVTSAYSNFGLYGIATGDLDGDGRCDLAVSAPNLRLDGVEGQGTVLVFSGDPVTTFSDEPAALIANLEPADTNGNFGRALRAADFDGDGLDELVIAHPFADAGGLTDRGAVRVFAGGPFPADPSVPIAATDADWTWTGAESADYATLGGSIQVDDLDGDGLPELGVGVAQGDGPVDADTVGTAVLFRGSALVLDGRDASAEAPWVSVAGDQASSYFGQAVAFVPDLGGDGLPDAIALAGRHDAYGIDAGAILSATSDAPPVALAMPGEASGADHGRGVAVFDADGDGASELIVGSPGDTFSTYGANAGTVTAFADGEAVGAPIGGGLANHSGGDSRGYLVQDLGDFDGDGWSDLAIASRNDSQPTSFDAQYSNATDCPGVSGSTSGVGSVAIHRGGPGGIAAAPTWVWYGPTVGGNVRALAGGFDYDGDGRGDLAVGSRNWYASSQGGFAIVYGRSAPSSGIQVICTSEAYYGEQTSAYFGEALAAVGDLDGDGCDELAVSAQLEDVLVGTGTVSNVGVIRLFYGHGATCAGGAQRVAVASSDLSGASAGTALAGGLDFDGDSVPDLAVGGTGIKVTGTEVGEVWIVPGSHLRSLPTITVGTGVLTGTIAVRAPLFPATGGPYGVAGTAPVGKFGDAVIVGEDDAGVPFVAVGAYDGDAGGAPRAGGGSLVRWVADAGLGAPGLDPVPFAIVGGETAIPNGDLGDTLGFGFDGGTPVLAVGAPLSSELGLQIGAAYAVRFE